MFSDELVALQRYVAEYEAVGRAIDGGDEPEAWRRLADCRRTRSSLEEIDRVISERKITPTPEGLLTLRQMMAHKRLITTLDEKVTAWLKHNASRSSDHLVQATLPLGWDAELDLVVVCKPATDFVAALQRAQQKRVLSWLPEQSTDELLKTLDGLSAEPPPRRLLIYPPDAKIEAALRPIIEEIVGAWQASHRTFLAKGELWRKNTEENLATILRTPTVNSLAGRFSGRPAIVVSPGPSLSKNIEQLKPLQDRAVFITSVQALISLTPVDVIADFAVLSESIDMRYTFAGYPIEKCGSLVVPFNAHPSSYRLHPRTYCYAANNQFDKWALAQRGEDCRLPGGGSVSTFAFMLALKLDCSAIILVGQDLSFPDGKMYIDSNVHGKSKMALSGDGQSFDVAMSGLTAEGSLYDDERNLHGKPAWLPGYYGGKVATSPDFEVFHRWFVRAAAHYGKDHRLYNCTEGGAFIAGMQHLPLGEVGARELTEPFSKQ